MAISLRDANVWLAVIVEGHVHHHAAFRWFMQQQNGSIALCRITQMAVLRLLTNSHAMGRVPRTVQQSWQITEELRCNQRVIFAPDSLPLENTWREVMTATGVGPSSWTDAYLAAFALIHSYRFVTFDAGFRRWRNLDLVLLSVAEIESHPQH